MLKTDRVEELRRYARIIGSLEEEIDEIKETSKIYNLELKAVGFNHLVSLIYTADKIADNVQDAAYHLATVVTMELYGLALATLLIYKNSLVLLGPTAWGSGFGRKRPSP